MLAANLDWNELRKVEKPRKANKTGRVKKPKDVSYIKRTDRVADITAELIDTAKRLKNLIDDLRNTTSPVGSVLARYPDMNPDRPSLRKEVDDMQERCMGLQKYLDDASRWGNDVDINIAEYPGISAHAHINAALSGRKEGNESARALMHMLNDAGITLPKNTSAVTALAELSGLDYGSISQALNAIKMPAATKTSEKSVKSVAKLISKK